ncbi:hypothetical protein [Actinokineospora sp.]|uniref:hypothetical protein n=1 Tax=Actinokineospora sp. TaxID=1872133 RepID=UPI00403823C3
MAAGGFAGMFYGQDIKWHHVTMLVSWCAMFVIGLAEHRRRRRWSTYGRALADTRPWRRSTARVASRRWWPAVVEVDDVGVLRVIGMPSAHRFLIARTGAVWVAGPDAAGWALVRVDGSHEPFLARLVRGPRRIAALSEAPEVTERWARSLRARAFGRLDRRLPALVAAGEWTRVDAVLGPWRTRLDGTARAHGAIRLADGRVMAVTMPRAAVDLLGTVWETGALWFAGTPEPGLTLAAGFPGYPLLAVARLSSGRT